MYLQSAVILTLLSVISAMTTIHRQRTFSYNVGQIKTLSNEMKKQFNEWNTKRYRNVSFTFGDEECLNNCKKTCITDWKAVEKPCEATEDIAPVYFTTRTQNKATCLSRCDKYGENYDWCLVDEDFNWDYCSSATYKLDNVYKNVDGDRCARPCEFDQKHKHYRCPDVWGVVKKCNHRRTFPFIPAKTIYGTPCATECAREKADSHTLSHYTCYDVNRNNERCALPATKIENIDELQKIYSAIHTPHTDDESYDINLILSDKQYS